MTENCKYSPDGTTKFVTKGWYNCDLIIKSSTTEEVIKKREFTNGENYPEGYSLDGGKVVFSSYCRHWICSPLISVWDFEKNRLYSISTEHEPMSLFASVAYNSDLSLVLAGCSKGGVSLIHPYEKRVVWHQDQILGYKVVARNFLFTHEEDLVWVTHNAGRTVLSLKDGSTVFR